MTDLAAMMQQTADAAPAIAKLDDAARAQLLHALAANLRTATAGILAENARDLEHMPKDDPRYDRLLLNDARINAIANDVANVATLPSPLGRVIEDRTLDNGLHITRISVPLGTIGVIYESRPNVTVDVFTLCFRAGNAAILKGGKEAAHSNTAFAAVIHGTLAAHGLDPALLCLLPPTREATAALLNAVGTVDVCIPRGSQSLIDYVRQNARVPVIETGAGIVHTYFDAAGDVAKGRAIITNAKTRRVSVCNALDTLVIHASRLNDLPALVADMADKGVEIFADKPAHDALAGKYPHLAPATPEHFGQEFLSHKMSVKTVASIDDALDHIRKYSSRHSEAIVTEDKTAASRFLHETDAAAVYVNASTAFTDGGQFGMGAEIGISTQKLHARGPMALDALTSYKWLVNGDGHIRT